MARQQSCQFPITKALVELLFVNGFSEFKRRYSPVHNKRIDVLGHNKNISWVYFASEQNVFMYILA